MKKNIALLLSLLASVVIYAQRVTGTNSLVTKGEVNSLINAESIITPSEITSDQDNYNPTGWDDATIVRLRGDNGIRAITSFAAPTSAAKPQRKILFIYTGYPLYVPAEHPDGTAANRVMGCQSYILRTMCSYLLVYSTTDSRWIISQLTSSYPSIKGPAYSFSAGSITAGDHSELGLFVSGTGAANTAVAATTSLPAALQMAAGTTTSGAAGIYFGKSVLQFSSFGTAHLYAEAVLTIPTLSDATNRYEINLVFQNAVSSSGLSTNSIAVQYSDNVNSGKWRLLSTDGGAGSATDLGITVAANTIYKIRIEYDKARTEAIVYINDAFAGRVNGNMPNAGTVGIKIEIVKSAGTTSRTALIHSMTAGAIYN